MTVNIDGYGNVTVPKIRIKKNKHGGRWSVWANGRWYKRDTWQAACTAAARLACGHIIWSLKQNRRYGDIL